MLTDKRILLDGDWTLTYAENRRVKRELTDAPLTIASLAEYGWQKVDAKVPGNFELDLQRAGVIDDPFFACNSIEYQKFENLHLFYSRKFTLDSVDANTVLRFEGVDTVADIFVNGKLIGKCDNMLIPFEFDGSALVEGENEIVVHITPAVIAAREYEIPVSSTHTSRGYDSLFIRKAPHMYGWDIMPRAISGGIWRSCYIEQRCPDRIDDLFVWTHRLDSDCKYAELGFFFNISVDDDCITDYSLSISGECGDSKFAQEKVRLHHTGGKIMIGVGAPKVWWPRNYGDPNVYDITATLFYKGEPVYEYKTSTGIRTAKLERTSTTDKDGSGEFVFVINGKKVFWHGTNWVPVDAYHSRDIERIPEILPMLTDLNCNCVRCWGGNVYENEIFYDFCDRNGIMVWQDFAHACGLNPQTEDYLAKFAHEVEVIVKQLRNHCSIVLWAGDNEVDISFSWNSGSIRRDPNANRLTREVIPNVLNAHDYTRPYLPSSPYVDEAAFEYIKNSSSEQGAISEGHLWGPRDYFKGPFYTGSICHFASETGYHGCNSPESIKRFIRPEQLWHWQKYPGDPNRAKIPVDDWCCHASCALLDGEDGYHYRIKLMSDQVKTLFVNFREDEVGEGLDRFARASQISQAEAKKYFIERFRVTKWRRTGIIWWNLIDGWPQFSDAIVDYYGIKKLAYHYVKRSQQQLCMIFDEPKDGVLPLHAVSDVQSDVKVRYRVTDLTEDKVIVESECLARANSSDIVYLKPMSQGEKHFYLIEWSYELGGKIITGKNHYYTNIRDLDLDEYLAYMEKAGFADEFEGF